jgi:bifunctional non-homologous end joining protein LigD
LTTSARHAGKEGPAASCALLLPPPAHWAACLIDGEAVACDDDGMPVFDRLRYRRDDRRVFLLRPDRAWRRRPSARTERRKVLLIQLLAKAPVGLQVNDHIVEPGDVVFRHACKLGLEGVVSKRLGSPYRSGRSRHWVKSNPAAKREVEEDWSRVTERA